MSSELLLNIAIFFGYLAIGKWLVSRPASGWRDLLFGLLNAGGIYVLYFRGGGAAFRLMFWVYLGWVAVQYLMLRLFSRKPGWLPWLAFSTPLLALVAVRYAPPRFLHLPEAPVSRCALFSGDFLLGLSQQSLGDAGSQRRRESARFRKIPRLLLFCPGHAGRPHQPLQ